MPALQLNYHIISENIYCALWLIIEIICMQIIAYIVRYIYVYILKVG